MGARIGIIGGSGLYAMDDLVDVEQRVIFTPFGEPSSPLVLGTLGSTRIAFLTRHGEGHVLTPSEVNYRANLWALKSLGVETLITVSAVGSLRHQHAPGSLRLPTQFIDKTYLRKSSFFGDGMVAHVAFGCPVCPRLVGQIETAAETIGLPVEKCGAYVCMEGPAFSTQAESLVNRAMGADLIGMTQATEAKLAREAEMCFANISLVTDFDAWREDTNAVANHDVMATMKANLGKAIQLLHEVVPHLLVGQECPCRNALAAALVTQPDRVPEATKDKLRLLLGKYGFA